jgi:hypothetical protein
MGTGNLKMQQPSHERQIYRTKRETIRIKPHV